MKDRAELIEYILQFIKNGDIKACIQDNKVVKITFRINDKENVLTLEDMNQLSKTG